MKKTKITLLILALVCLAGTGIWYFQRHTSTAPEMVLYYAENQTEDYPTTLGGIRFAELVEERTNGRIRILVKAEAELGSENEVLTQLAYGGIAFSRVSISQIAELIPEFNVLQLPYLYTDSAHMWRVLEGEIGDEFLQIVEQIGLKGLSWYDAGARSFYTRTPVYSPEDLEGLAIRIQESDMMADMIEALGARPVRVAYSEVYSSLEQGISDGAENNWPSYEAMKHYEVAPYFTVDEHTRVPEMQLCSLTIWNQLSEEDQKILQECAAESAQYERELWKQREEEAKERAVENGASVIELDEEQKQRFREIIQKIYPKYSQDQMDLVKRILQQ